MEDKIKKIKQKIIETYVEYNDNLKKAEAKKEELENLKKDLQLLLHYSGKESD